MPDEVTFRMFLASILICTAAIRAYYGISSKRAGGRISISENKLITGIMSIVGLFGAYLLFGYLIFPDTVVWSALPLPSWLRWVGVALGITTIPLFFSVHHTLGKYFSAALQVKKEHVLVTSGLYRWVRHPMYAVLLLLMMTFFLVSANWAIGVTFLGVSAVILSSRVGKEEAMMVKKFGNEYRTYQQRTGCLFAANFLLLIIVLCLIVFAILWLMSTFILGFF
nr:isoprenylcysteine carboxylmethyltransferase family protein [Candidatus Njordarchaeota archaeon]